MATVQYAPAVTILKPSTIKSIQASYFCQVTFEKEEKLAMFTLQTAWLNVRGGNGSVLSERNHSLADRPLTRRPYTYWEALKQDTGSHGRRTLFLSL